MNHADLAWLAAAIYDDRGQFEWRAAGRGFQILDREPLAHAGSEAALVWQDPADVTRSRPSAAIVFRGTEASRLKLRDLWSNLTWPWPTVWQGDGRVHAGYRRHLNMIPQVLPLAEAIAADVPLYAAGHSMGGALATLFASWYYHATRHKRPPYKLAGLVTFGAPKALDRRAAGWIYCRKAIYRVDGDFAPLWPPVAGLVHPAPAIALPPLRPSDGPLRRHDAWGYHRQVETLRGRLDP